jgi:hypothetical protein
VKALVLAVLAAACTSTPRVDDCGDDLAGVWHEQDHADRGYHFLHSRSGGYEVFAMFDSAVPPDGSDKRSAPIAYAPWVWDLERLPSGVAGKRTQRMTRDGVSCAAVTAVTVRACRDGQLTIDVEPVTGVDFASCAVGAGPAVPLVLER